MSRKKGGGDSKAQFWDAIGTQNLRTVRWGVANAGVAPATRNNDGLTSFMLAASLGCHRSLAELVRWYERRLQQLRECLSQVDDDGRTCLHLACACTSLGGAKCVAELLDAWLTVNGKDREAGLRLKDGKSKTPLQVAEAARNTKAADVIREWLTEPETDSEDEAAAEDGLTSTQRSKLKKLQLQSNERKGMPPASSQNGDGDGDGDDDDDDDDAGEEAERPAATTTVVVSQPKATWPEVVAAFESVEVKLTPVYELAIDRRSSESSSDPLLLEPFAAVGDGVVEPSVIDPALWWVASLNRLHLKLPPTSLAALPSGGLARLTNLTILIVSGHALEALPATLGDLPLKNIDAARNRLAALPAKMPPTLESIDLSGNALTSVEALGGCTNLVSILVDANPALADLHLPFPDFKRLVTLSACGCAVASLDPQVGSLAKLETLALNDCPIVELPPSLRDCKKLKLIKVSGTAIADNKVLGYINKGEMKQLAKYWEKTAGANSKGGKGGGGGKKGGKR